VIAPVESPPRSLWSVLDERRGRQPVLTVWEDGWRSWSWDEWRQQALRFAGGLAALGVCPGDRVAICLENSLLSCAAVLGTWFAGGCLVSLPAIARGVSESAYLEGLGRLLEVAEPAVVLLGSGLVEPFRDSGSRVRVHDVNRVSRSGNFEPCPLGDDDEVFVQFSSGSTSAPRGCVLTAGAISAQLDLLSVALEVDPHRDVKVDWLPLSHDMGLFGCLVLSAYWNGVPQVLSTPERFVLNPICWLEDCARFGATLACGPDFALSLVSRLGRHREMRDLCLRAVVLGGEPNQLPTLRRARAAAALSELSCGVLVPAYGLAEATLAVTMTPLGQGPTVVWADRDALASGRVELHDPGTDAEDRLRPVVAAGVPLPGVEVSAGARGMVGQISIRSPSLASRYLGEPGGAPSGFAEDGLLTSDRGFVHEGKLFPVGRSDDLLFVAGRNVYASDIELAVAARGLASPGRVAVVAVESSDGSRLVVVLEPSDSHHDLKVLAMELAAVAREMAGAAVRDFVFLPPGGFPRTPSGKLQRFRCRELAHEKNATQAQRLRI
jgi:fatty-acyl-CoA synthase